MLIIGFYFVFFCSEIIYLNGSFVSGAIDGFIQIAAKCISLSKIRRYQILLNYVFLSNLLEICCLNSNTIRFLTPSLLPYLYILRQYFKRLIYNHVTIIMLCFIIKPI